MTSSIESNTFHGRQSVSPGFVGLYSTRVASERRRNHRSMIEECYQQFFMASADVWPCFSAGKVASCCFLLCFCMLRHCTLYKIRFGTVSRLSWTSLPKTEAHGQAVGSLHWEPWSFDRAYDIKKEQKRHHFEMVWLLRLEHFRHRQTKLVVAIVANRKPFSTGIAYFKLVFQRYCRKWLQILAILVIFVNFLGFQGNTDCLHVSLSQLHSL